MVNYIKCFIYMCVSACVLCVRMCVFVCVSMSVTVYVCVCERERTRLKIILAFSFTFDDFSKWVTVYYERFLERLIFLRLSYWMHHRVDIIIICFLIIFFTFWKFILCSFYSMHRLQFLTFTLSFILHSIQLIVFSHYRNHFDLFRVVWHYTLQKYFILRNFREIIRNIC